jgi:response regulator RpfG family c-di-GMP phosphodiesterase
MNNIYTIVAVDDEPFVMTALRRVLETEEPPYYLFITTDLKSALTFIQNNKVDLIISDYHMPMMNGFEFFRKADAINKNTIKILLTGTPDAAINDENISKIGIYKVIAKPFDNETLKRTIREALKTIPSSEQSE